LKTLESENSRAGRGSNPCSAYSARSNGLSACADTTIVLDHDQNGRTLYVRGRDVEEKETAVTFSDGQWSVLGNASDVRRSDERRVILDALVDNNGPMTPAQLTAATGQPGTNIRQLLLKMAKNGEVYKVGKGRYWLRPYTDNSDHTDNS